MASRSRSNSVSSGASPPRQVGRSGAQNGRSRSRSLSRSKSRSVSRSVSRDRRSGARRGGISRSRSPVVQRRRYDTNIDNPNPSKCVGCFGLSLHTREKDIYDLFARFGDIDDVQLVYDNHTGRSRGFAFIYFKELSDAKMAKEKLHDTEVDGRNIRCDYSITKRAHTPTPGVYMGKSTRRDTRGYRGTYRDGANDGGSSRRYSRGRYEDRGTRRSRSRSYDRGHERYDRRY